MNLTSIVNMNEDRTERKTANSPIKSGINRKHGYSIYESLEYVKGNLGNSSFKLQMEMMKSFIR